MAKRAPGRLGSGSANIAAESAIRAGRHLNPNFYHAISKISTWTRAGGQRFERPFRPPVPEGGAVSGPEAGRGGRKADAETRLQIRAIGASLAVAGSLMAAKFYVYRITGSSAVFSDAVESIINVAAAAFAMGSILMAAKPPDEDHPYGHGKVEYFSAGFEGALILLAAVGIFQVGMDGLMNPRPLPRLDLGLLVLVGTSLVNLLLGLALIRVGRQTRSLALVADGKHVLTDVYTSVGVVAGLVAVWWTGWYWLDGALAILVGLNIVWSGVGLVRQSVDRLMDASDPDLLAEITGRINQFRRPAWIDVHQLRAWHAGRMLFVDLHLILHRNMPLRQAHAESEILAGRIRDHFGGMVEVLVHLDPCEPEDCPVCPDSGCGVRGAPYRKREDWDTRRLTAPPEARPESRPKSPKETLDEP
jgi:cation diffusion facilitator family transporter